MRHGKAIELCSKNEILDKKILAISIQNEINNDWQN